MKRNVINSILILLLMFIITSLFFTTISNADSFSSINIDYVTTDAKDNSTAGNSILKVIQALLVIIQVAATGAAIIMLIVLAIKYISSAPSEKASIKNSAIQYVVGAVILFSTAGVLSIIRNFSEKNINQGN